MKWRQALVEVVSIDKLFEVNFQVDPSVALVQVGPDRVQVEVEIRQTHCAEFSSLDWILNQISGWILGQIFGWILDSIIHRIILVRILDQILGQIRSWILDWILFRIFNQIFGWIHWQNLRFPVFVDPGKSVALNKI
jgi:hypothetical protein